MAAKLFTPERKIYQPDIQVTQFRDPEREHHYRDSRIGEMSRAARAVRATMMPFVLGSPLPMKIVPLDPPFTVALLKTSFPPHSKNVIP